MYNDETWVTDGRNNAWAQYGKGKEEGFPVAVPSDNKRMYTDNDTQLSEIQ